MLSLDRRRYGKLILLLKNDYAKQQNNYPKNLTDMYGLILVFNPTRPTPVYRGRNEVMNFGNVVVEPRTGAGGYYCGVGGTVRKIECWRCGGDHMRRDCPKRAKDKENKKKDGEDSKNKRAEVTGEQIHAIFTS